LLFVFNVAVTPLTPSKVIVPTPSKTFARTADPVSERPPRLSAYKPLSVAALHLHFHQWRS
jgi:hypothetical protein